MNAKSIKNDFKRDWSFRGGKVTKTTKIAQIRALGSNCAPSLQKGFPGTQNIQKTSKNEPPGFQNRSKSWESGHPKSRKSENERLQDMSPLASQITQHYKSVLNCRSVSRNLSALLWEFWGYIARESQRVLWCYIDLCTLKQRCSWRPIEAPDWGRGGTSGLPSEYTVWIRWRSDDFTAHCKHIVIFSRTACRQMLASANQGRVRD